MRPALHGPFQVRGQLHGEAGLQQGPQMPRQATSRADCDCEARPARTALEAEGGHVRMVAHRPLAGAAE